MTNAIQQVKIVLLICVICACLAACIPRTTMVNGLKCLQPKLNDIPTQMPLRWDTDRGRNPRRIPAREAIPEWMVPQLGWSQKWQIPDVDYAVDMTVDENTVWMAYFDIIVRYNISTHKLNLYKFDELVSPLEIMDILITKDHTLWVAGKHLSQKQQYAVLFRYSPKDDSFKIVDDVDHLLRPKINSRERVLHFGQDRVLKESPLGDLLVLTGDGIYAYSPSSNKAALVYNNPAMDISAIEADPRGMIWFTVDNDEHVWMISSESDQPHSIELPDLFLGTVKSDNASFLDGYTLYLDSHERLWVQEWGFLDTSKQDFTWHFLNPSPLFVSLYDPDFVYTWGEPETYEAQDGSIWFNFQNGVIRYGLETESACWISPVPGQIAETRDGTIWILLNNQLFKYEPE